MEIHRLPVGQMQANCYLVIDDSNKQVTIIDPGAEADFISDEILRLKVKPVRILFTHGHFDHVLAAFDLVMNFAVPCYLSKKDLEIYKHSRSSSQYWQKTNPSVTSPLISKLNFLDQNDQFLIDDHPLTIIETPGHTPGSVVYHISNHLFTGDTLFSDAVGSTDHQYSDPRQLKVSLSKISQLPPHTEIHPGHGEESNLKDALSLTAMGY